MKKGYLFLIIGFILLSIGIGVYFYYAKNKQDSNQSNLNNFPYNGVRVSATNELDENLSNTENTNSSVENQSAQEDDTNTNETNENQTNTSSQNLTETEPKKEETETEIADFTTKIYTKDSERQNNISITCSSLNDTTVDNGATFSFCDTVGKATSAKGYEKADVYQDGEVVQALGGGNCQVSSTLYNAVLEVEGLNVTERHEHSNSVPYVSKGKDAAVAYGSYDFKFVNNTGKKIKITASCDDGFVYIKIFKLS